MLNCTVKFCGGCNPRYDRGNAYREIVRDVGDIAAFSLPKEKTHYDLLLIIRGCTGCPYLYEDIDATHRIICTSEEDVKHAPSKIRALI